MVHVLCVYLRDIPGGDKKKGETKRTRLKSDSRKDPFVDDDEKRGATRKMEQRNEHTSFSYLNVISLRTHTNTETHTQAEVSVFALAARAVMNVNETFLCLLVE